MTKEEKEQTVVFSVRWPKWLFDQVNSYCASEERSRNWMIKKRMSEAMGTTDRIGNKPGPEDDV